MPDWAVAAPLLAIAAAFDVARHRIPNAISVAVAVLGIASALLRAGPRAALLALAALAVVFAALLVPWRRGFLGGGDLKLAAAAAAWVGLGGLWRYGLASGVTLGVLAAVSYVASTRSARREIRANLALAGRGIAAPIEIGAGRGRVPVPAGAAFAFGALWTLVFGG